MTRGKFYNLAERDKAIRKLYKELRADDTTVTKSLKEIQANPKYDYLAIKTLIRIVGSKS